MQVADTKGMMIETGLHEVYAMQRLENSTTEHDARGLIAAVGLSVACWVVLGYFLLV
ncbi:hypothetical protein MTR62_07765 [Novosphingobium sp. 1949]|uniref:Uncharacterized protein n=1 Tax=Novosphingobium organovorum TaxID=2930092 RepID=A0ABT0BC03_9SPHN|nr:hypothetical protein [Novosphingobium organovorum]MCJ2182587.1 hypothetical protein [Novosphingobium organovorum]